MDTVPKPKRGQRSWTAAQRAEQGRKIRERKIWINSTDPRTAKGKSISCLNALKHGQYSRPVKSFMTHFRKYRAWIRSCWAQRAQFIQIQQNELRDRRPTRHPSSITCTPNPMAFRPSLTIFKSSPSTGEDLGGGENLNLCTYAPTPIPTFPRQGGRRRKNERDLQSETIPLKSSTQKDTPQT